MNMNTETKVYDVLKTLEISYDKYDHQAVYTVEEATKYASEAPGKDCKNLFMRNRKGNVHYLLMARADASVNLKELSKQIGSTNLSFASKERLMKHLSLEPGSVSPFGLVNNVEKNIVVLVDSKLKDNELVTFHPNINTATLSLRYEDFEKFLDWYGNGFKYVDL